MSTLFYCGHKMKEIITKYTDTETEHYFKGLSNSNGIAYGKLIWHPSFEEIITSKSEIRYDSEDLIKAIQIAKRQLEKLSSRVDKEASAFLQFQIAVLSDQDFLNTLKGELKRKKSAEEAWKNHLNQIIEQYRNLDDQYFRERYEDFLDIRNRVLGIMIGHKANRNYIGETIFVGKQLMLSQFLEMDLEKVKGIALFYENDFSHLAVLAQAKKIPIIFKLQARPEDFQEESYGILDSLNSVLIMNPSIKCISNYESQGYRFFDQKTSEKNKNKNKKKTDWVIEEIAKKIIKGEYEEGQKLPIEIELAESFGVGRNIIREGIKFLSAKGLLFTGPRKGTIVKSKSDWSIFDHEVINWGIESVNRDSSFYNHLFEFRILLEPIVSQQAALRIEEKQKIMLKKKLEIFEKSMEDPQNRNLAEINFHQQIYRSTNNIFLSSLFHLVKVSIKENQKLHHFEFPTNIRICKKVVEAILNEKASDAFNSSLDLVRLIRNEQDRINNIKFKYL